MICRIDWLDDTTYKNQTYKKMACEYAVMEYAYDRPYLRSAYGAVIR